MGGRAGGGASGGMGSRSRGGGTYGKIADAERGIVGNDYETLIAFDDNGNITFQAKGDAHSVFYQDKDVKDAIVTHNHPSGGSFSGKDLAGMVESNMKEMRIIGKEYTYSMKRPKSGWGKTAEEVEKATNFLRKNVTMPRYEARKTGNAKTDRKIWIEETTKTTTLIAKKYGWNFKVTKN